MVLLHAQGATVDRATIEFRRGHHVLAADTKGELWD